MRVSVIGVGRLREAFWRDACTEYVKRLSRYCTPRVEDSTEFPEPDKPSDALRLRVMEQEGEALLKRIPQGDEVIALCVEGTQYTSEQLAELLLKARDAGHNVSFVIGGSLGLSPQVKARADTRLSLSRMTLPHALARVVVLEQIYRAFKIIAGERYHK